PLGPEARIDFKHKINNECKENYLNKFKLLVQSSHPAEHCAHILNSDYNDVEPAGTDMLKHPLIATLLLISIAVVSCSASSHHAVDDEHHDGDSLDELEA
uniref:Secreted protein n=1 Tax=Macrostomum lignano TaxID=282301 RepID=A0A1I8FZ11_9PLAT